MKTIIITGCSRGIGREVVKSLLQDRDNKVIAISRNEELLKTLGNECNLLPGKFHYIAFDLNTKDYSNEILPKLKSISSSFDILINNAGLLINKSLCELTDDDFDSMFNTNIKSAFKLTQTVFPFMNEDSHIVNISSMGGYQGSVKFPGLSLYSASKGALSIFTECMAEELKDRKISCNCLALGAVQTEMLEEAFPGYKTPINPEDMAEYISDFALNSHKFMNGKIIPLSLSTP